jgi:hypothetical protein
MQLNLETKEEFDKYVLELIADKLDIALYKTDSATVKVIISLNGEQICSDYINI